ncbi:hypothetical protein STANM309S_01021 [Streptomyces tanashiensis]
MVEVDGGDDGDGGVDDVRRVPGAAHADLDDGRDAFTGASAKAAYAMPVRTSKKERRYSSRASTSSTYGLTSWYVSMNRSAEIGAPSRLIRSVMVCTCGEV